MTTIITVPKLKFKARLRKGKIGYWIAECISLPGCMTQGKIKSEAIENLQEAIAAWLETAQAHPEIWEGKFRSSCTKDR